MEKWKTPDEISHRCLLHVVRNLDGNKADIFLHEHDNRLNNAVCAKTTFAEERNPSRGLVAAFTQKRAYTAALPCILGHACGT